MLMLQSVPRKGFGSADFDTIQIFYLSLLTQTAHAYPFRGTRCIIKTFKTNVDNNCGVKKKIYPMHR